MRRAVVAALAAALLAGAAHPRAAGAQDATAFAQQRYTRGVALFERGEFRGAGAEFRASLALYGSPNARLYLARCDAELGELVDAALEYERAMREAEDRARVDPRYAPTARAARAELADVARRIGHVTIELAARPPGLRVRVGAREVPADALGLAVPVPPGRVDVEVSAAGFAAERRAVDVAAGESTRVAIALVPLAAAPRAQAQDRPALRTAARVAGAVELGVGALGFVAAGVSFALATQRFATLDDACNGGECPSAQLDAIAGGRTYQTLTNVGLGVGIAGAALGALTLVLFGREPARGPARVAAGPGGATVRF